MRDIAADAQLERALKIIVQKTGSPEAAVEALTRDLQGASKYAANWIRLMITHLGGNSCFCADQHCPAHMLRTECTNPASTRVFRVDMDDSDGTAMCSECAEDAHASGLFTDTHQECN